MSTPTVFVIKNQAGQFLNKQQEWVDGGDRQALYRAAHRDEAVNTVFEVSSKDIYLRAEAIACPVDSKGQPLPQGADLLTQDATVDNVANDAEPALEVSDSQETLDSQEAEAPNSSEHSDALEAPLEPVIASDAQEAMAETSVETAAINA